MVSSKLKLQNNSYRGEGWNLAEKTVALSLLCVNTESETRREGGGWKNVFSCEILSLPQEEKIVTQYRNYPHSGVLVLFGQWNIFSPELNDFTNSIHLHTLPSRALSPSSHTKTLTSVDQELPEKESQLTQCRVEEEVEGRVSCSTLNVLILLLLLPHFHLQNMDQWILDLSPPTSTHTHKHTNTLPSHFGIRSLQANICPNRMWRVRQCRGELGGSSVSILK